MLETQRDPAHRHNESGRSRAAVYASRRRLRAAVALSGVLLLAAGLTGCAGGGTGVAPTASPSAAVPASEGGDAGAKAQELFTANKCISCHGVDLAGRVGPSTNLQKIGATQTKEQIAEQIRNGGGGMPAYKSKLSEDEVNQLADWLSSKK
ncbi:c-type cytochrome [Paenibacillus athensensis]|nr:cytochrome c [Paenibacillus athensensis]MCD1258722.1 c-type cytochrome [Paenibacillus athensensis]